MSEQQKKHKENLPLGGGGSGFGFTDGADNNTVNVGCGPYNENLSVAGMSIEQIRKRFKGRLEIDDKAVAVVDGNDVDNDYVVNLGQKLQFIHKSGEKGFVFDLTEEEIAWLCFSMGAATSATTTKAGHITNERLKLVNDLLAKFAERKEKE